MKIIATYTKKWLTYIVSFFLFFTVVLLVSEYLHEKKFRTEALNEKLNNYAGIANRYITRYRLLESNNPSRLDSFLDMLPEKAIRITLINDKGMVLFDSEVRNPAAMENHLSRPEIQKALIGESGTDIRLSGTTNIKYYYYARKFHGYFVRVSAVYDIDAKRFIQPDRIFLLFIVLFFLGASLTIIIITDKFGKSITTLRKFTLQALANKPIDEKMVFPENELGIIGQDIIDIYHRLNQTKEELLSEKAKLIRHLNMLEDGIGIFTREFKPITSNNHFIRLLNHISDQRVFSAEEVFRIPEFTPFLTFFDKYVNNDQADLSNLQPTYEITLNKGGKIFSVKSIVFQDRSFEVLSMILPGRPNENFSSNK